MRITNEVKWFLGLFDKADTDGDGALSWEDASPCAEPLDAADRKIRANGVLKDPGVLAQIRPALVNAELRKSCGSLGQFRLGSDAARAPVLVRA